MTRDSSRSIAAVVVSFALMLASTGCGRDEGLPGATQSIGTVGGESPVRDLNVILVTIDTLRSDRVSCYGSDRVATPSIDDFADQGVRFANAASTVPFTLPAHSSIMTGLYPPGHGVRENVGYTLGPAVPTVAELLGRAGWSTAGFVSAFVLDARWGIGRGFDHYFDDFDLSGMESPNLSSVQRSGDVTIAEAVRWLDGRPQDRPFFLWLHLYDPHDPYTPPEPYASQYPGRPYDGEVAYTDSLIGRFKRALDKRGLLDSSLVILTADHGEGLGDHGEASHGFFLYDTTIHVVMVVRRPGGAGGGRVVDAAVSHVDLVPTILEAAGVGAPDTLHGRSLLPLMEGKVDRVERDVYSESLYPLLHYGWAPLRALRGDDFKLISAPRPELFAPAADPSEEHDLAVEDALRTADFEQRLAELRERIEPDAPAAAAADIDPQTLAQLEALGYAAGQGGVDLEDEGDRPRADPKDKITLHRRIMQAQWEMRDDPTAAVRTLNEVLVEDQEIIDAHQMLGQLAATRDDFEVALAHYRRALELSPEHKNSLLGMASSYRALGRDEEALLGFRRVLELSGNDTRATLAIADIEFERGRLDAAAAALADAAATTEAPALIANKLGEVRAQQGRLEEAVTLFESALGENDVFAVPHFNLAVLLEDRGQLEEAVTHYEKAIELAPRYHQAQFNLGLLMGEQGRIDRTEELWKASLESNPDFVQGYYHLAKLMMDRGQDLAAAEDLVRRGIAKDPKNSQGPLGYYVLADVLNRRGRRAEADVALATGKRIQSGVN